MLRETGAGVGTSTMNRHLNKERDFEKIYLRLKEEFAEIDINQDGTITIAEIV